MEGGREREKGREREEEGNRSKDGIKILEISEGEIMGETVYCASLCLIISIS